MYHFTPGTRLGIRDSDILSGVGGILFHQSTYKALESVMTVNAINLTESIKVKFLGEGFSRSSSCGGKTHSECGQHHSIQDMDCI